MMMNGLRKIPMTIEEAQEHFRRLGLRKAYRPYQEPETGVILLKVRRPAQIVDGRLQGSEIDLYEPSTFRVWTGRKKKAKAIAQRCGLRARLMDGEAELFVSAALADTVLPAFGAKTRRELTAGQLAVARLRMERINNGPNSRKSNGKIAVAAAQDHGVAP